MAAKTYWGFHANFARAELFVLSKDRLALGWPGVGDLSLFGKDVEAFKTRLKQNQ